MASMNANPDSFPAGIKGERCGDPAEFCRDTEAQP